MIDVSKIKVPQAVAITVVILSLTSGSGAIFAFDRTLFMSLDIWKLLLLSVGITGPVFSLFAFVWMSFYHPNIYKYENLLAQEMNSVCLIASTFTSLSIGSFAIMKAVKPELTFLHFSIIITLLFLSIIILSFFPWGKKRIASTDAPAESGAGSD
jgi:hypothetical protein